MSTNPPNPALDFTAGEKAAVSEAEGQTPFPPADPAVISPPPAPESKLTPAPEKDPNDGAELVDGSGPVWIFARKDGGIVNVRVSLMAGKPAFMIEKD